MFFHSIRWFPVLVLVLVPVVAKGQAYCALRDPVGSIYTLFPEADGYRSIVKVVGNDARKRIREKLGLDLHFNELGKHTVYVAVKDGRPLGVVHARSEPDKWGLTEIAWGLTLDLEVVDFYFQRSRNPRGSDFQRSSFAKRLAGANFSALRRYESEPGRPGGSDDELASLWSLVLRSALKTIVVTEASWATELRTLRADRARYAAAGSFDNVSELVRVTTPYTLNVLSSLRLLELEEELNVPRRELLLFKALGAKQEALGYFIAAPWRSGTTEAYLYWKLSSAGRILKVSTLDQRISPELQKSLESLRGLAPTDTEQCANALELSALEMSVLARGHHVAGVE